MASSFSFNAISNVWQNIEPFLALEDTIATAQTCKSLHNKCIDAETRKVKVSHLTTIKMDQYSRLLPLALNYIHFPSLRRLQYPPRKGGIIAYCDAAIDRILINNDVADEAIVACFPIFVVNLSHANNLEYLALNASPSIQSENSGGQTIKWIIELFGRNLQNCYKLKELKVNNQWWAEDDEGAVRTVYSVNLMKAITPAISKRKNELEVLSLTTGGRATDPDHASKNDFQVSTEFFSAVLSARKLAFLNIEISKSSLLADSLLKVVGGSSEFDSSNNFQAELERLRLVIDLGHEHDGLVRVLLHPIMPLLGCFTNSCQSLRDVTLAIPNEFWSERESLHAFTKFIKQKTKLKALMCDFDNHRDDDGKIFDAFTDCALAKSTDLHSLQFGQLNGVVSSKLSKFVKLMDNVGMGLDFTSCRDEMRNDVETCNIRQISFIQDH